MRMRTQPMNGSTNCICSAGCAACSVHVSTKKCNVWPCAMLLGTRNITFANTRFHGRPPFMTDTTAFATEADSTVDARHEAMLDNVNHARENDSVTSTVVEPDAHVPLETSSRSACFTPRVRALMAAGVLGGAVECANGVYPACQWQTSGKSATTFERYMSRTAVRAALADKYHVDVEVVRYKEDNVTVLVVPGSRYRIEVWTPPAAGDMMDKDAAAVDVAAAAADGVPGAVWERARIAQLVDACVEESPRGAVTKRAKSWQFADGYVMVSSTETLPHIDLMVYVIFTACIRLQRAYKLRDRRNRCRGRKTGQGVVADADPTMGSSTRLPPKLIGKAEYPLLAPPVQDASTPTPALASVVASVQAFEDDILTCIRTAMVTRQYTSSQSAGANGPGNHLSRSSCAPVGSMAIQICTYASGSMLPGDDAVHAVQAVQPGRKQKRAVQPLRKRRRENELDERSDNGDYCAFSTAHVNQLPRVDDIIGKEQKVTAAQMAASVLASNPATLSELLGGVLASANKHLTECIASLCYKL